MAEWADFCVYWTARLALACYATSLALRMLAAERPTWLRAARRLWIIGYGVFLFHLAAAFHFVHGWSHDAAYAETARRTFETVGIDWGGGVYVNHAFAIFWTVDVFWWWLFPAHYLNRSRWIEWSVQGFLGFIAFNSTAIFGRGAIRFVGWAAALALALVAVVKLRRSSSTPAAP
jgi:hypothetical protein